MALSKLGLFVTRGLGRLFGLESVDSGVWQSNPMVVMAIVFGLLAALRLRSPRSLWVIAAAVLGSIALWVIPAVAEGDGPWLEPVLAALVGGLLAVAVLVVVEPLLPEAGLRLDPDYPD